MADGDEAEAKLADGDDAAGESADSDDAFGAFASAGFRISAVCIMHKRQSENLSVRGEFVIAAPVDVAVSAPGAEAGLVNLIFDFFE